MNNKLKICENCGKPYEGIGKRYCSHWCCNQWTPKKKNRCGEIHKRCKQGRINDSNGYILIRLPNHPKAVRGYVREHRLVMEKKIGRFLEEKEIIHHINGKRDDNRIENLELYQLGQPIGHQIVCPCCNHRFTN